MQVPAVQFVGAQVFATPAPPHFDPAGHAPHWSVPPPPSPMVPQYWPVAVLHVSGMQPAPGTQTPLLQTRLESHMPQSMARPQPLPTEPQQLPLVVAHISGMQLAPPTQTFPSQTWSAGQLPQSIIP